VGTRLDLIANRRRGFQLEPYNVKFIYASSFFLLKKRGLTVDSIRPFNLPQRFTPAYYLEIPELNSPTFFAILLRVYLIRL
jgi:hypothetical protein